MHILTVGDPRMGRVLIREQPLYSRPSISAGALCHTPVDAMEYSVAMAT